VVACTCRSSQSCILSNPINRVCVRVYPCKFILHSVEIRLNAISLLYLIQQSGFYFLLLGRMWRRRNMIKQKKQNTTQSINAHIPPTEHHCYIIIIIVISVFSSRRCFFFNSSKHVNQLVSLFIKTKIGRMGFPVHTIFEPRPSIGLILNSSGIA